MKNFNGLFSIALLILAVVIGCSSLQYSVDKGKPKLGIPFDTQPDNVTVNQETSDISNNTTPLNLP
ncbi:MAG: hypothetical protein PHU91_02095 [Candidatus Omnitrophica bacterium]|nr:hypothetical protein [Candidatus Omnitrophota bacterium]MDD5236446.1 hypothetical protein [Candidatus Omnitrophota bacterium]MDD5610746.1 hypothetical protein [Candidatus Omnitrophota bacterium]